MSEATTALRKWKCDYCGHIYDEAEGDTTQGIAPGTRFEDLPADWTCPECAAFAFDFKVVDN